MDAVLYGIIDASIRGREPTGDFDLAITTTVVERDGDGGTGDGVAVGRSDVDGVGVRVAVTEDVGLGD